jgi:hypothetical protein
MSNEGKQTNSAEPDGVPQQEGPAIAGSSCEESQADHTVLLTGAAGPANIELEWAKKHVPGNRTVHKPPKSVFRKTELLGIAPPAEPDAVRKTRQRTLKNIRDPDGEVAYRPFEDSFRTFICSLVERQERIYDEMLLHTADLAQRIDALERQRAKEQKTQGTTEAQG